MAVDAKTMEIKKTQQVGTQTSNKESAASKWRLRDFISDVKAELKKITWTSPDELRAYTKIVVATTFIMGMGIYAMDLIIQTVLNGLGFVIQWIGG